MEGTMREIARILRSSIYSTSSFRRSKRKVTKLPIILCAVAGILLGSLAFKFVDGRINNIGSLKNDISQSKPAVEVVNNNNSNGFEALEFFKDELFKFLGMDRYNPITIVNANYPYFKMFYENQYLQYTAQLEQQELFKQKQISDEELLKKAQLVEVQNSIDKINANAAGSNVLKEVSSSLTFEGDVDDTDLKNNPIVSSGKINIKNETKYSIDINKLLNDPLKLAANKKGPQILVYQTHTTESFLKTIKEFSMNVASRTSNNRYNVVRVGEALTNNLEK